MTELTAENVQRIVQACLYNEDDDTSNAVIHEGVVIRMGFHPDRIAEHRDEIEDMLNQLPSEFHKDGKGGMSFLNACMRRDGVQWGEHRNIEELVLLGLATGMVKYLLPREAWIALPGGMPYFVVSTETSG